MTTRRAFVTALAAALAAPAWARTAGRETREPVRLAATWQTRDSYQIGVLAHSAAGRLQIAAALEVPTRAHGLLAEPGGTLLTVARRPGDWLLRWNRDGAAQAWRWIEPGRAFTGHVLSGRDGKKIYTTETDIESGAGLIGVREGNSLEKLAEWPTQGIDPHQLVWDGNSLIVANGGVATQPETGRAKRNLERMDSSLVRLDATSGELLGQWRLDDRRLSLRHLAWGGRTLGIAQQAEHDQPATKATSPVLALFDGRTLRPVPAPRSLAGYGGDIAALGNGFAVSCPRAQGVALFDGDGTWLGFMPLDEACALALAGDRLWAGGRARVLAMQTLATTKDAETSVPGIRLDNHWISLM